MEVKNLNSFRAVKAAVEYEIERQARILDAGGRSSGSPWAGTTLAG